MVVARRGLVRAAAAACVATMLLLTARTTPLDAHPLHTTITEITFDAQRRTMHVVVRLFADDFARAAGGDAPAPAGALTPRTTNYLRRSFRLSDGDKPLPLRACGTKRAGDLIWICFEAPAPLELSRVRVTNVLLCDLFEDQINIVRTTVGGTARTVLLTKHEGTKGLS